jgi:hypothetical protein
MAFPFEAPVPFLPSPAHEAFLFRILPPGRRDYFRVAGLSLHRAEREWSFQLPQADFALPVQ